MEKLISIDLKADFGFLRKPDTNDGIALSYNMLHKPAVLGILGAIMGYRGYEKFGELPEYYQKLKGYKVGIAPIGANHNGNFQKTVITYTNTVGYANKDGNLILTESTLIKPAYRLYLLTDDDVLCGMLENQQAEYLPYLGKNEFPLIWNGYSEYNFQPFAFDEDYCVSSIFIKKDTVADKERQDSDLDIMGLLNQPDSPFFYFERLPIGFEEMTSKRGKEYQYLMEPFAYTNATFGNSWRIEGLYELEKDVIVQVF